MMFLYGLGAEKVGKRICTNQKDIKLYRGIKQLIYMRLLTGTVQSYLLCKNGKHYAMKILKA
jgi:hypothetical protein